MESTTGGLLPAVCSAIRTEIGLTSVASGVLENLAFGNENRYFDPAWRRVALWLQGHAGGSEVVSHHAKKSAPRRPAGKYSKRRRSSPNSCRACAAYRSCSADRREPPPVSFPWERVTGAVGNRYMNPTRRNPGLSSPDAA